MAAGMLVAGLVGLVFERLVIRGLGLDRHPELFASYFPHYRKLCYIAQVADPEAEQRGRALAAAMALHPRLGCRSPLAALDAALLRAIAARMPPDWGPAPALGPPD